MRTARRRSPSRPGPLGWWWRVALVLASLYALYVAGTIALALWLGSRA